MLFCTTAFAVPSLPRIDHNSDIATDKGTTKVNQSSSLGERTTSQVWDDNLNRSSSSSTISQPPSSRVVASDGGAGSTAQSILTSSTRPTSARVPTSTTGSADGVDSTDSSESDDSSDNTTLLIDYNQQTYRSSSPSGESRATASTIIGVIDVSGATGGSPGTELATTTSPVLAGSNGESLSPLEGDKQTASTIARRDVSGTEVKTLPGTLSNFTEATGEEKLGEMRAKPDAARDMRDARISDKVTHNTTEMFATLFKKKPYSKYWSVEQKWDDIFKRFMAIQGTVKTMMMKNFLRDIEYYADVSISKKCADDLRYIQNYTAKSTNMRWLAHMFDSTGKSESGMLTGNLANLGHVVQCIKVRAPARFSNETFEERYFEQQAAKLGERFRGKYCLASLRPVLPEKPRLVSRFSEILNPALLSNISYMGEPVSVLKQRALETTVSESVYDSIDRLHNRLDQIPFESELYQYLIGTRNFAFALPRFMGVCYPSSCTRDDIRYSIQKSVDDQHQVVDIEFECEVEESDAWEWFTTPRLVVHLLLALVVGVSVGASFIRHILVDRLQLKQQLNSATPISGGGGDKNISRLSNLIATLDMLSMDKCAGILFIKTKPASPIIDKLKVENNRSTSIDALRGFLVMVLVYSELVHLGCLPVPFMWSKWSDAMFPFFRGFATQIFLNTPIWSEAFYTISAYLISLKVFENYRSTSALADGKPATRRLPPLSSFVLKRYIRLLLPMVAFMLLGYVWPRLSNGFVMQDQAAKILAPCDTHGWTNMLMFHNHYAINETCLWPSHVSASFFQLHLVSYPILMLLLVSLRRTQGSPGNNKSSGRNEQLLQKLLAGAGLAAALALAAIGLVYSALRASGEELIVPFLIDYIDFDNYQRVIEWTVLPTHNHLASYMVGILLAYMVARSRARNSGSDSRADAADWRSSGEVYMQRESSLESVVSSSTQELSLKPVFLFPNNEKLHQQHDKHQRLAAGAAASITSSASSAVTSASSMRADGGEGALLRNWLYRLLIEVALVLAMLASLTASYFWNGLGRPMSAQQTFWYMIGTKLSFTLAFACFFYRHFALRRNSSNPWMITRFLVPIGRMSLMLFYVSWTVIWFDLLASLYQWHPSHYFIFEKYNEIMFIALVVSMLAYGAFEGTVKIIQYQKRAARLNKQQRPRSSPLGNQHQRHKVTGQVGFENLFQPTDWQEQEQQQSSRLQQTLRAAGADKSARGPDNQMFSKGSSSAMLVTDPSGQNNKTTGLCVPPSSSHYHRTKGSPVSTSAARKRLSVADQYKLNAELRANYSFASIGLYESAGATDDLPSSNQQQQQHSSVGGDPQVSPGRQTSR